MPQEITALVAIREYFQMTMAEMKAEVLKLSPEDREELGALSAAELGKTIKTKK